MKKTLPNGDVMETKNGQTTVTLTNENQLKMLRNMKRAFRQAYAREYHAARKLIDVISDSFADMPTTTRDTLVQAIAQFYKDTSI